MCRSLSWYTHHPWQDTGLESPMRQLLSVDPLTRTWPKAQHAAHGLLPACRARACSPARLLVSVNAQHLQAGSDAQRTVVPPPSVASTSMQEVMAST